MKPHKALAGLLLLLYAVAVHWSLIAGREDIAVLALLVLCLGLAAFFIAYTRRVNALLVVATAVVSLFLATSFLRGSSLPIVLFPLIINLGLCWMFGRTLRRGREALITRFARIVDEGELPPEVVRYTRHVTWLWTLAFAALALETILLATFAKPEVWSLFANGINYLLVAGLFAAEYGYRRWRFRHRPHPSPLQFLISLTKVDWRRLSLR